mgnify:CR=1 FL=1
MTKAYVFVDLEVNPENGTILDMGAWRSDKTSWHGHSCAELDTFIAQSDFIIGHNILRHDLRYLEGKVNALSQLTPIDTLPLSPLLFPNCSFQSAPIMRS